ncbi:MAG: hypothetical protein QNJ20_09880 [Paracoccaceae bacterium]|nr:hypothetical protein [Paracoccaceae bacterium]
MHRFLTWAVFFLGLAACGGVSWNTTVANHPQVRDAMLASVVPGKTTEKRFILQWGHPTQKLREGAQMSFIYRDMSNPPGYYVPQFGNSQAFVVVVFQYGLAVGAYSSDTEGCRATFAPRPPGPAFDNPSTVHSVNCGVAYDGSSERRPIAEGIEWIVAQAGRGTPASSGAPQSTPMVPQDRYIGGKLK